jgi:hypothetical protein
MLIFADIFYRILTTVGPTAVQRYPHLAPMEVCEQIFGITHISFYRRHEPQQIAVN